MPTDTHDEANNSRVSQFQERVRKKLSFNVMLIQYLETSLRQEATYMFNLYPAAQIRAPNMSISIFNYLFSAYNL